MSQVARRAEVPSLYLRTKSLLTPTMFALAEKDVRLDQVIMSDGFAAIADAHTYASGFGH